MQISVKDGEVYAKRSVNIGDVSIEVNILYPDKLSWNGVVNDECTNRFYI
jgi:hypothetical protein